MTEEVELDYLRLTELRKKRTTRLVACVVFGLVFVLFVAGTAWSLSSDDYPWTEGEFAADIVTIVVSAALAVFTGLRARTLARRAAAFEATLPSRRFSWLPPASAGDPKLRTQVRRLRVTSLRSVAVFVAWVGVLLIGVSGFVALEVIGQRLLDSGKRVDAVVESVHEPRRGSSSITVTYLAGGTSRTARIYRNWNSDLSYAPGQILTVVHDSADPSRVRTLAERNDNQVVEGASMALIIAAVLLGIPFSALSMSGWRGRYRAVRATGWRRARAAITQMGRHPATMTVKYGDGSTIDLRVVSHTMRRVRTHEAPVPVWVGGADRHMVIVVPGDGPRVVPVKADAPRQDDDGWAP